MLTQHPPNVQVVALAALSTPRVEAVGVATASVDLGNEWLKVGLVKVRSGSVCVRAGARECACATSFTMSGTAV